MQATKHPTAAPFFFFIPNVIYAELINIPIKRPKSPANIKPPIELIPTNTQIKEDNNFVRYIYEL